ncbi:YccF domain-containing protein [Ornithinimicrobium sp. Y1847]|uniref:YccF domain-containing protein n=1 Tax=Ornithinimicrobium sp. Y1847 TaxID=3405419 RepID=UPI003B674705
MRFLLNLIWLVFGGLWLALAYFFFGLIACIFIITIPFGIASFRIGAYALWPFGRTIVPTRNAGAMSTIGNVIWFIVAGVWIAVAHLTTAVAQALTIIGIPLAIANIKMIPVSLVPLGKEIVDNDQLGAGAQPLVSVPQGWGEQTRRS